MDLFGASLAGGVGFIGFTGFQRVEREMCQRQMPMTETPMPAQVVMPELYGWGNRCVGANNYTDPPKPPLEPSKASGLISTKVSQSLR